MRSGRATRRRVRGGIPLAPLAADTGIVRRSRRRAATWAGPLGSVDSTAIWISLPGVGAESPTDGNLLGKMPWVQPGQGVTGWIIHRSRDSRNSVMVAIRPTKTLRSPVTTTRTPTPGPSRSRCWNDATRRPPSIPSKAAVNPSQRSRSNTKFGNRCSGGTESPLVGKV